MTMTLKSPVAAMATLLGLAAAGGPAVSYAANAPVNLAPNSQWEIFSGEGYGARMNIEGTGTMPPIPVSAYTTGSNTVVFTVAGATGELKVGDLVTISGAGADPALTICPLRVTAVTANASFTAQAPLGRKPGVSHAVTATPINIGMRPGSTNTGDAADGWKKTTTLEVWREDNYQNLPSGKPATTPYYALGVKKDLAAGEYVATEPDVTRFRGKTVTFGAYVYQKVRGGAGAWRAFVQSSDGVTTSAAAATTGGYQWLEVSYTVPADAISFAAGLYLDGAAGDTYYIADPVLTVGTAIGVDNYIKPQETFIPVVHISPISWINANIVFPSTKDARANSFDVYAETGGQVAPTVRHAFGELEGIDGGAVQVNSGLSRVIAFFDRDTAPTKSGSFLPQYVAGVKSFGPLDLPLDGTGHAVYVTGVAGDSWSNVSLEMDGFFLQ